MTEPKKKRRYSTGFPELDDLIADLIASSEFTEQDGAIIADIVTSGLLLGKDAASRLDLKIVNAALKEMRYAFRVFAPYREVKKVSVFGSARTKPGDPDYDQSVAFGRTIAEHGWMVVTGAGPGSMEAANLGAGAAQSFGVNIRLPFESEANAVIADDPKLMNFKYFFTRKLMFIKEASAFVLLPGGFGTMDEAFELLTLIQTGKSNMHPVVLLDSPGGSYWTNFVDFITRDLVGRGYASDPDLHLFTVTDDVHVAADELATFYANYDSMRFVGRNLILRLQRTPDAAALADLTARYADITKSGEITVIEPQPSEVRDGDALDKARIAFHFDRMSYGRLRQLIDELNQLPSLAEAPGSAAASS